jgi:tetratricopeptide (TPR) repeat protein
VVLLYSFIQLDAHLPNHTSITEKKYVFLTEHGNSDDLTDGDRSCLIKLKEISYWLPQNLAQVIFTSDWDMLMGLVRRFLVIQEDRICFQSKVQCFCLPPVSHSILNRTTTDDDQVATFHNDVAQKFISFDDSFPLAAYHQLWYQINCQKPELHKITEDCKTLVAMMRIYPESFLVTPHIELERIIRKCHIKNLPFPIIHTVMEVLIDIYLIYKVTTPEAVDHASEFFDLMTERKIEDKHLLIIVKCLFVQINALDSDGKFAEANSVMKNVDKTLLDRLLVISEALRNRQRLYANGERLTISSIQYLSEVQVMKLVLHMNDVNEIYDAINVISTVDSHHIAISLLLKNLALLRWLNGRTKEALKLLDQAQDIIFHNAILSENSERPLIEVWKVKLGILCELFSFDEALKLYTTTVDFMHKHNMLAYRFNLCGVLLSRFSGFYPKEQRRKIENEVWECINAVYSAMESDISVESDCIIVISSAVPFFGKHGEYSLVRECMDAIEAWKPNNPDGNKLKSSIVYSVDWVQTKYIFDIKDIPEDRSPSSLLRYAVILNMSGRYEEAFLYLNRCYVSMFATISFTRKLHGSYYIHIQLEQTRGNQNFKKGQAYYFYKVSRARN